MTQYEAVTCAWCEKPAVTEGEIEPTGTRTIVTSNGKVPSFKASRRVPACAAHGNPDLSAPVHRQAKQPKGQTSIFDMLGDEAT